jgi:hypothetical protein
MKSRGIAVAMNTSGLMLETNVGNVSQDRVRALWDGEAFAKVRYYHETSQWDKMPFCKSCNGERRTAVRIRERRQGAPVSVILPNYNHGSLLPRSLGALFAAERSAPGNPGRRRRINR